MARLTRFSPWRYDPEELWAILSAATGETTKSGLVRLLGENPKIATQVANDAFRRARLSPGKIARWTSAASRPGFRILWLTDYDGHTTFLGIDSEAPLAWIVDQVVAALPPTAPASPAAEPTAPDERRPRWVGSVGALRTSLIQLRRALGDAPGAPVDQVIDLLDGFADPLPLTEVRPEDVLPPEPGEGPVEPPEPAARRPLHPQTRALLEAFKAVGATEEEIGSLLDDVLLGREAFLAECKALFDAPTEADPARDG